MDEHLKVLGLLGVPPDGRAMDLPLLPEEREEAGRLLSDLPPDRAPSPFTRERAGRYGGGPRSGSPSSARGSGIPGVEPVYAFGPTEKPLADAVDSWWRARGLPAPRSAAPRTMRVLGALFERTDAVVTNNTGPMHVAAAVGAPGVFIHGPTPVARWQPPGEAWVPVCASDVPCRPCDSPRCRKDRLLCMEAVTVGQVRAALDGVLDSAPARRLL